MDYKLEYDIMKTLYATSKCAKDKDKFIENVSTNTSNTMADNDDIDMNSYCLREVEPMGKEVEAMMVTALTEYLGIKLKIEYLDGKSFDKELSCVLLNVFEGENNYDVCLLYRPGHYDILYI
jgi:hypothetical protein